MNTKKNLLASTIAFFMGSAVQGVVAQEDVGGQEENGWALEEVVVTAQKREQRLIDVPISVAAIGEEIIRDAGIKNMSDLSYLVPNLSVQKQNGGSQIVAIRGISNVVGSSPLVGLYLDEMPLSISPLLKVDLEASDLQRLEVLRGPQGTLYGIGSVGGTIRFITKNPTFDHLDGEMSLSAYNTDGSGWSEELTAILNLPVVDNTLAFRLVATYKDKSGWIDQPATNSDNSNDNEILNVRLKGLWQISEKLSANITALQYDSDAGGHNTANLGAAVDSNYQIVFRDGLDFPSTDIDYQYDLYNLTLIYDFGFSTLTASTSHVEAENKVSSLSTYLTFAPAPGTTSGTLAIDETISIKGFSQEIRLAGNTSTLDWVVGVFYTDVEDVLYDASNGAYVDGVATYLLTDLGIFRSSESTAVFGSLSYSIDSKWTITAGTRYFEDTKTQEVPSFNLSENDSFYSLSSKLALAYAITDNANLYLSASEGFRSGGFNFFSSTPYGPESVISYEFGAKASLLDGRLISEGAIFHSRYSDYQDSAVDPQSGGTLTLNPGEAEINGIEWSTQVKATKYMSLGFSGNITESEFTKTSEDVGIYRVGDTLNFIPKFSYALSADFNFRWPSSIPGFARFDYSRQGPSSHINRSAGLLNGVDESDSIGIFNAQLGAQWDAFTVRFYGRNLNNEKRSGNASLNRNYVQSRPRTLGVEFSYEF